MLLLLRFTGLYRVGAKRVVFLADNLIAYDDTVALDGKRIYQIWKTKNNEYYVIYETENINYYAFYLASNIPEDAEPVKELKTTIYKCPKCGSTNLEWVDYEEWICYSCGSNLTEEGLSPIEEEITVYSFKELPNDAEVKGGKRIDLDYIVRKYNLVGKISKWNKGYLGVAGHSCVVYIKMEHSEILPYPSKDTGIEINIGLGYYEESFYDEIPKEGLFGKYISVIYEKRRFPTSQVMYAMIDLTRDEAIECINEFVKYLVWNRWNVLKNDVLSLFDALRNYAGFSQEELRDYIWNIANKSIKEYLVSNPLRTSLSRINEDLLKLVFDDEIKSIILQKIHEDILSKSIEELKEYGLEYIERVIGLLTNLGIEIPSSLLDIREELEIRNFFTLEDEDIIRICIATIDAIEKGILNIDDIYDYVVKATEIKIPKSQIIIPIYVAVKVLGKHEELIGDYVPPSDLLSLIEDLIIIVKRSMEKPEEKRMAEMDIGKLLGLAIDISPLWSDGVIFFEDDIFPIKKSKYRDDEYYFSRNWRSLTETFIEKSGVAPYELLQTIGVKNLALVKEEYAVIPYKYKIVRDLARKYTVIRLIKKLDIIT